MFDNLYDGKKVFVTGHTGFKGGWLLLWLSRMGAQVTGYSLQPPGEPNLYQAAGLGREVDHVHGDVRDAALLARTVRELAPEFVFHLAAQPLVRPSYADPLGTYETNVMGTANLLEAVRGCESVRSVVVVTSDKCYDNREWLWGYRESDPMGGHDPYSSSKGCAELVTSAYTNSFFPAATYDTAHKTAVATARAGNVIGGGDWGHDRLLPDCIRAFSASETVVLRNPLAVRPWQHVLDPLAGYLTLAARLYTQGPDFAGGWNFGPDDGTARTVEDVVARSCALWGEARYTIKTEENAPHEAGLLKLDCSKARHRLGWAPRIQLDDALSLTVPWYLRYYSGESPDELRRAILERIEAYMENRP